MNICGFTDKGKIRSSNQDSFIIGKMDDGSIWAVVCDGMGGANGGNVASRMAVDNLSASLKSGYRPNMSESSVKNLLFTAVAAANIRVFDKSREDSSLNGMGTTVVAVLICDSIAYIAHAGDSRAYLLSNNVLTQLTRDHSIVQNMVEDGKLTTEEARVHPRKNVITRALGVEESVDAEFTVVDLSNGDSLLLCTDGLTNYATPDEIVSAFQNVDDDVAKRLVDIANNNGGGDNITAVVINKTVQ